MEKSYNGLARGIRSTPEDDEVASLDRERIEDGSARGTALKVGFSLNHSALFNRRHMLAARKGKEVLIWS